ncbi:hypothetical protein [Methylopila turkensis]|uniref:Uncharacterized protein n=1 Tax=Methylopila turkensis TaxID=1437816 RepID=A0A9W6JMS9_9HYPH|nr:hypothetical protein [Methylopila turkensis]GLK79113.1 hypothetical protein GCM10008174_08540 [Methylopila turkensis]
MRIPEGLLRARSQIVFLVALFVSTLAIVQLETLDLDARSRARAAAEMRAEAIAGRPPQPELEEPLRAAAARAEAAFARSEPGSAAALLMALSASVEAGFVRREHAAPRVEAAVAALRKENAETPQAAAASAMAAVAFPEHASKLIEAANLRAER